MGAVDTTQTMGMYTSSVLKNYPLADCFRNCRINKKLAGWRVETVGTDTLTHTSPVFQSYPLADCFSKCHFTRNLQGGGWGTVGMDTWEHIITRASELPANRLLQQMPLHKNIALPLKPSKNEGRAQTQPRPFSV